MIDPKILTALEKLGERRRPGTNLATVRVLDIRGDQEADAFLQSIKKQFEQMAPGTKLILPDPLPKPKKTTADDKKNEAAKSSSADAKKEGKSSNSESSKNGDKAGKSEKKEEPAESSTS